jgi:hypothetical protein
MYDELEDWHMLFFLLMLIYSILVFPREQPDKARG